MRQNQQRNAEAQVDIEQTQEPMMAITVRQRDRMLYRIRELEGEVIKLRAQIAGMKLGDSKSGPTGNDYA